MKWFVHVFVCFLVACALPSFAMSLPAGFKVKQFKTTDNVSLQYYESAVAVPDELTVVFVPGWTMPGWIWFEQATNVATKVRTIVLDPRGQGASAISSGGYNYARRARDIAELLAACQCQKVVLIGWSLGGLEALQYSHDFASAGLAGLVLVDHSVGTGTPPKWDPTFLPRLKSAQRKTMSSFVNGMFKTKPEPAWLAQLLESSMKLPADLSVQLLSQPTPREFWRDAFLTTPAPILYAVVPRFSEQAQIMKQAKPNIQISIYDKAGHALFIDQSTRFAVELVAFIQALPEYQVRTKAK
jgi:non-heme chloroperoxidase